ncbi:asparagine synthetase B, partial [Paraburkholderia sp. SIMBA_050]
LYLRQLSVPAPHTIYRGISKLPPGTFIQFEHARDTPPVRAYWTLEQAIEAGRERPFEGNADEAVGQLDAILRQAVARQMEA